MQKTIKLSAKQWQVAKLVAAGYTNQVIADHLGIAKTTLKTHLIDITSKWGVSTKGGQYNVRVLITLQVIKIIMAAKEQARKEAEHAQNNGKGLSQTPRKLQGKNSIQDE